MVKNIHKSAIRFLSVIFSVTILGCTVSFQEVEFRRAERQERKKNFGEALKHYSRIVKRAPESDTALEASRRASRLAFLETKNFPEAIAFYKHLVMYSKSPEERIEAQKKIAEIYFEKSDNFSQAIIEYGRLLKISHTKDENYFYRFRIVKSHFQNNNFDQSLEEVKALLEEQVSPDRQFELKLFKANIFLTTKKVDEAIALFHELMQLNPEKAVIENVGINLSVAHEEKKDFQKAIDVLESIKDTYPTQEFIDLKIKRLKERARNQPGASGLKK